MSRAQLDGQAVWIVWTNAGRTGAFNPSGAAFSEEAISILWGAGLRGHDSGRFFISTKFQILIHHIPHAQCWTAGTRQSAGAYLEDFEHLNFLPVRDKMESEVEQQLKI